MCCFTQPIEDVGGTKIFVRDAGGGRQFLVYSMHIAPATTRSRWQSLFARLRGSVDASLAMVLPLPVPAGSGENALRFIDLSNYPRFFNDLDTGFYRPTRSWGGDGAPMAAAAGRPILEVHKVGGFDASYVPTRADFDRLDDRFKLPGNLFDHVPQYRHYGFAVFKLRADAPKEIHPMAFEFPRRDPDKLFVPTVHVHDGRFHPVAHFDHTIYCQSDETMGHQFEQGFEGTHEKASNFMEMERARGIIDPDRPVYRRKLNQAYRNADVRIRRNGHERAELVFDGAIEDLRYGGNTGEFIHALIGEILLNRDDVLRDMRPASTRTASELTRQLAPFRYGAAEFLENFERLQREHDENVRLATRQTRERLRDDVERARKVFVREKPVTGTIAQFDRELEQVLAGRLS